MDEDNGFGEWGGYMNAKITKLEEQYDKSRELYQKTNLFAGISIFVNGLTNPSADELKRIMMVHGGTFHHYQRSHTTYVIASNLADTKIRNMNTSNVLSPQWIVDCLKEKRILDYKKYLLYTNHKPSQPKINFPKITEKKQNTTNETFTIKTVNECDGETLKILNSLNELHEKLREISTQTNLNSNENDTIGNSSPAMFDDEDEVILPSPQSRKSKKRKRIKLKKNEESATSIEDKQLSTSVGRKESVTSIEDKEIPTSARDKELSASTQPKEPLITKESKNQTTFKAGTSGIAKTAVDPNFLSEFYNNSRLHHISTLGAGFKQYITELREDNSGEFPKTGILREKLKKVENFKSSTTIMHIDMDCFFVSVGLRSHPELKGQPVAVTHSKGSGAITTRPGVDRQREMELYTKRINQKFHDNVTSDRTNKIRDGFDSNDSLSEIASCSYEARKMGVKNGMFVGQALKLCPQLKTIPYDFEGYKEVAFTLYNTIAQYTLNIEAVSCDEMFVDLTDLLNDIQVDTMDFVEFIRDEVKTKTGCPCSAGLGGNRLQARMATKHAKPDGKFFLHPENVFDYMTNISISDLPGVGYSTTFSLNELGCKTCGDLQKLSLSKLQNVLGKKFGETLYQFCRGIDNRPLTYGQIRKSVSAEVNYGIRFNEFTELETFLQQLCTVVHSRLTKIKRKGKSITLKLMIRAKDAPLETAKYMGHGFCDYITKSVSLPDFTDNLEVISKNVLFTIKSLNIPPKELRGIGIQITKLDNPNQESTTTRREYNIKTLFNKAMQKKSNSNTNSSVQSNNRTVDVKTTENNRREVAIQVNPPLNLVNKSPNKIGMKKSPIKINNNKSNARKKQRGRPTKSKESVKTLDIASMFHKSASKRSHPSVDEIDPEVLAELPEDIREEVVKDYVKMRKIETALNKNQRSNNIPIPSTSKEGNNKNSSSSSPSKAKIQVDAEFLNVLPSPLRKEVEKQISLQSDKIIITKNQNNDSGTSNGTICSEEEYEKDRSREISDTNIFMQKNCQELMKAWVDSADIPEEYDVEILSQHAVDLIQADNMYDLYDPLVFLKRVIDKKPSCDWHTAFKCIIQKVQDKMKQIYKGRLFLDEKINCDKCS